MRVLNLTRRWRILILVGGGGGSGSVPPWKILKFRLSEMRFPRFSGKLQKKLPSEIHLQKRRQDGNHYHLTVVIGNRILSVKEN